AHLSLQGLAGEIDARFRSRTEVAGKVRRLRAGGEAQRELRRARRRAAETRVLLQGEEVVHHGLLRGGTRVISGIRASVGDVSRLLRLQLGAVRVHGGPG